MKEYVNSDDSKAYNHQYVNYPKGLKERLISDLFGVTNLDRVKLSDLRLANAVNKPLTVNKLKGLSSKMDFVPVQCRGYYPIIKDADILAAETTLKSDHSKSAVKQRGKQDGKAKKPFNPQSVKKKDDTSPNQQSIIGFIRILGANSTKSDDSTIKSPPCTVEDPSISQVDGKRTPGSTSSLQSTNHEEFVLASPPSIKSTGVVNRYLLSDSFSPTLDIPRAFGIGNNIDCSATQSPNKDSALPTEWEWPSKYSSHR